MKFNLRENVPILNRGAPAATKIAALAFLISYCIFLHLLVDVIFAAHLLSAKRLSSSPKISDDSLRTLMLFTVAVLAVWALVKGFLIAHLFLRRRWAKNVLSAVTILISVVMLLTHLMHPENASLNLSNNLEHVAEIIAVIFLFTPKSIAWFRFRA